MPQPDYSIHIYDPTNVRIHIVRAVRNARYRIAENDVGDFDLTVPYSDAVVDDLVPPNHVEFWRGSTFAFGGFIRKQELNQEGRTAFYTVSGPSYMAWLSDSRNKSATGTGDITYPSDNLDDVMKNVVRTHVLDTNAKFLVAADSGLSSVTSNYVATGYETVLETLQGIATRAGDTTFDIIRDTDRLLRFRTWTPSRGPDHSKGQPGAVLFDLRGGNITKAQWIRDGTNVVNALWGGGPGDKAARYIWPVGEAHLDSDSILDWGRIEGFFDAGTEGTTSVEPKTRDELKKTAVPEESVNFTISEFGRYTLGEDFDYGTKVTVVWGDILEFTDTIRGMEVKFEEGAAVAHVDINVGGTLTGDSTTRAILKLGQFLRSLRKSGELSGRH